MHRRSTIALLLLLAGGLARPATAELVVLTGGEVLKVSAYRVGETTVRLELPSGGRLTLPLLRVERILADEVAPEPPPAPPREGIAFRFEEGQAAPQTPYGELIYAAAQRHGLNPAVVAAMVRVESAYDPRAVSHKGARGLLQLMPATAERFGVAVDELHDPARNLEAGTRYLRWLVDRFGEDDPGLVFAAYNAGEGSVARYGGIPPYRETQGYVKKLLALLAPPAAPSSVIAAR